MTTTIVPTKSAISKEIYYPDGDGKPMAESDLHRHVMNHCTESLEYFFSGRDDVYVAGNNFLYYVEGTPRRVVSPDCYVVFGVSPHPRKSYKVWNENGHLPSVVIEITSDSTRNQDVESKYDLYQDVLGIPEYFMFDPTADYIDSQLIGFRLTDQGYEPIPSDSYGRLHSEQLGLDLFAEGYQLRFFDPVRGEILPTNQELRERAEQEAQRAEQEAQANAELREQLAQTQARLEVLEKQIQEAASLRQSGDTPRVNDTAEN